MRFIAGKNRLLFKTILAIICPVQTVQSHSDCGKSSGTRRDTMPTKNRILVVDDEEALRIVLSAELEGEGYQVSNAADGQEAINILKKQEFDLILLDIKMPNVDGFEVLKYVKERLPKTKVIMLTGFADLKNAIESKKLGAEDFISKPYDLVDLLTTVERVLTSA
jgi:DNA-binding NtrC family response regulator